jgi:cytochrome c peroxidase
MTAPATKDSVHRRLRLRLAALALGLCAGGPATGDAPATLGLPGAAVAHDHARVALGRRLFMDPQLSFDGAIACASCHVPEQSFASRAGTVAFGRGGKPLARNAPSLFNAGLAAPLFRDGRAANLEEQVSGPLLHDDEQWNPSPEALVARLRALPGYARAFDEAFPGEGLTRRTLPAALAADERSLVAGGSPFDRYSYGSEPDALSRDAQAGYTVFVWSSCDTCHRIDGGHAAFTDNRFHNVGIEWARVSGRLGPRKTAADAGRAAVTGDPADRFAFRTPSLRNVALTAPYMHDGSLATLREVVDWYDSGGGDDPGRHPALRRLALTEEQKRQLVAFLESLTSPGASALAREARESLRR